MLCTGFCNDYFADCCNCCCQDCCHTVDFDFDLISCCDDSCCTCTTLFFTISGAESPFDVINTSCRAIYYDSVNERWMINNDTNFIRVIVTCTDTRTFKVRLQHNQWNSPFCAAYDSDSVDESFTVEADSCNDISFEGTFELPCGGDITVKIDSVPCFGNSIDCQCYDSVPTTMYAHFYPQQGCTCIGTVDYSDIYHPVYPYTAELTFDSAVGGWVGSTSPCGTDADLYLWCHEGHWLVWINGPEVTLYTEEDQNPEHEGLIVTGCGCPFWRYLGEAYPDGQYDSVFTHFYTFCENHPDVGYEPAKFGVVYWLGVCGCEGDGLGRRFLGIIINETP